MSLARAIFERGPRSPGAQSHALMEPPKLGKRQWFCTECGHVGRCANGPDFAVVLERAVGGDPRACVCAQKGACEKRRLAKLAVEPRGLRVLHRGRGEKGRC